MERLGIKIAATSLQNDKLTHQPSTVEQGTYIVLRQNQSSPLRRIFVSQGMFLLWLHSPSEFAPLPFALFELSRVSFSII